MRMLIAARIEIALFMTLLESTIVSTSVITITNDLGGYVKSSWLFTSYLLTYGCRYYIYVREPLSVKC
jgi:MFS family permease